MERSVIRGLSPLSDLPRIALRSIRASYPAPMPIPRPHTRFFRLARRRLYR